MWIVMATDRSSIPGRESIRAYGMFIDQETAEEWIADQETGSNLYSLYMRDPSTYGTLSL